MRRLSLLLLLATACRAPSARAPDAGPAPAFDAGPVDAGRPAEDAGPAPDAGPALPDDGGPLVLTPWVDPFIGTGEGAPDYNLNNAGAHLFPGAVTPFGMVQLSPDTTNGAGGYRYRQRIIHGFSATHFSGRGISCYQEFPVMPWVGSLAASPGTHWSDFSSGFDHASESARPGYYRVHLDGPDADVELSATTRTGMARFTFPSTAQATLLLNAGGSANGDQPGTGVHFVSDQEVEGTALSGNCGGNFTYQLYFVARFDRAPSSRGTWAGDSLADGGDSATDPQSGAYLVFDATTQTKVVMKFGLSWVSLDKARANLDAESPGFDLDAVAAQTEAEWNDRLNAIQVRGGTDDQRTVFYTALYHALIHPSVFSDADGEYLGFDGARHTEAGHTQFHNFPGWDNYRSQMRLLPILFPALASQMGQSLVNDAQQDPGGGLPRWEHANRNSGGMVGDSQDVVLAGLHAFGARDFDAHAALAAMRHGAEDTRATCTGHPVREGLDEYLSRGYVADDHWGSASLTLEYANDDFAVSRLALALGDSTTAATYLARSKKWQSLVDPASGWLVPRRAVDAGYYDADPTSQNGWVEGSGGQYAWMVPYDAEGLFAALGGRDAALARLDDHVQELNAGPGSSRLFMGNEPELGTPWLYDFAGQPHRTQQLVRDIWLSLFSTDPGGYPGNDDGGALASWVVFSALGLYPAIPGVGGLVVGSPLFPEARVRLGGGTLHIVAPQAEATAPYVTRLRLNGLDFPGPWLDWGQLERGGELRFDLSDQPDPSWGADPALAPPSYE